MKESLEDLEDGVNVGRAIVKTMRFADDKAVVCSTKESLQGMINKVKRAIEKCEMKIDTTKTKVMRNTRRQGPPINRQIGDEAVNEISHFKYFGSIITHEGNRSEEIKSRRAQGYSHPTIWTAIEALNKEAVLVKTS
ncbi:uncharacterized protein [Palaemon carinicauda]|uniref:uncharacterized protein n=1 Tax=Palaemon carinicauda TaxID=392227 RepID=UPI0035B5BA90